jgi:hypothetical protein
MVKETGVPREKHRHVIDKLYFYFYFYYDVMLYQAHFAMNGVQAHHFSRNIH